MSFFNSLTSLGTQYADNPSERRSIFVANTMSLVIACTGYIIFIIYLKWYGSSVITTAIPLISTLCLVPLALNHFDMSKMGRFWVSLFIPVAVMTLSVYSKIIYYYRQEELDYFTFRIIILSCCIFPPILFSTKEKLYLFASSAAILVVLMLHDPLHNFFGVPYRSQGVKESNYMFTNFIVFFMYIMTTGAVIFMKSISEANEDKANKLIDELNVTNRKLNEKNREVEEQNEEITKYVNNLDVNRKKLTDAYKIIEEQRNLLFVQNKNLSTELIEKNKELTETNNELIRHNNELRQFSYTVSHNLRGPVASLMGLLKLFDRQTLGPDNHDIFHHIETSTQRLDAIIKDLSKIIDIRNDIFQIRQQIDLAHETNEVLQGLNREIISYNIKVVQNHNDTRIIYSVRPMVHSIIYNLISNAIKYRSPQRDSIIEITTHEEKHFYVIEVRDNGLGIDLSRDRDNLFKLYKRFHHHTEGKGLGLYLVKLQAEALGGTIAVNSELNKYTHFIVRLRKPENAERQVLVAEEGCEIFFDATLNSVGIIWKKHLEDPIVVLRKIVEFIKVYNTPNYIADLSRMGNATEAGIEILYTYIIPETAANGLRRIAVIVPDARKAYEHHDVTRIIEMYKISLRYFTDFEESVEWVSEANKTRV